MAHVDTTTATVVGAADEVASLLAEMGVSQRELARRLGWPQPRIQRRIAGDIPITVRDLERIADALGVPLSTLLPADDTPAEVTS